MKAGISGMSRCIRFSLLAGSMGIAALTAAGCSSGGGTVAGAAHRATVTETSPSATASASASTHPTSSVESPQEKAALAAYQGMMADWVSAALTSNYQDPALAHHMSGSALSEVTRMLAVDQSEGAVGRGEPKVLDISFGQEVPVGDPTEIVVNSCVDDSAWLQYTTGGQLFNHIPGGRHKTQILVQNESGTWKVDQLSSIGVGTC